ncbi:hypothetical protein UCRPC4_g06419 [Phaeomoniella chlamydospora]|uniref:Early meiotic induction protein 1 n=1 Tax=Phaeomoniella chlamydospora TaxID=158046 RepID=A0A0G2DW80_PHACM|nr:hypothetical protein UCRPC4_g06419 [Phaeomoniella chlamydospora]
MGWWPFWSGPIAVDGATDTSPATAPLPAQGNTRILQDAPSTPQTPTTVSGLNRDDKANLEFAQFLAEFEAEAAREREAAAKRAQSSPEEINQNPNVATRIRNFTSQFKSKSSDLHGAPRDKDGSQLTLISDEDPTNVSFEALAEEQVSCRTAFDYAFYCQSMGGQFTNVYRYGELRSCSHLWDEFWLCMRTKSYSDERKRKMIKQHNIEKLKRWRSGPSSEDVWEVRDKLDLDSPEPFKGDYVRLEKEMEEWKKRTGNENIKL